MRSVLIAAALAIPSAITSAQTPPQGQVTPTPPQISTSATGEARVQPDRASIFFSVETRALTAAQAGAENARRQRAVLDTLRKLGLGEGQLSTAGYVVTPEVRHDQKQPQVVGYVARNTIRAEVQRIDQVGSLIDAALGAGANVVSSLRFYSSRADEARRLALADAVAKARADAEALARAAGGSLGNLIEVSTSGPARPFYGEEVVMARAAADTQPTPIEPGEQTVTVFVSARWGFVAGGR
jgi:uncharacterized protein YggE